MWSDCFVFKLAANQCGHIEFLFLKSSRRKRGQNAFWIQFFLNKSDAKLKELINSPAKASVSFFNASIILVDLLSKANHKVLLNFFFIQSSNKRNQKINRTKSPVSFVLMIMKDDQLTSGKTTNWHLDGTIQGFWAPGDEACFTLSASLKEAAKDWALQRKLDRNCSIIAIIVGRWGINTD